ncbi:MAG TPA: deoxyhypusine synthase family protein [Methylomirabilota bacterium]|nr:deoxyhypusine synthase family protein [Methylomirabilota bacterium]
MLDGPVSSYLKRHFRHFNAATLIEAAEAYGRHVDNGGRMFLSLAGAMSTAELGISLAEMIRREQIHAICCTGANLEEDVFNLIGHHDYERVSDYYDLTPADEQALLDRRMNRVTDTCIPEDVMRRVEKAIAPEWLAADREGERLLPHQFFYRVLREEKLKKYYQIDPRDSWLYAAMQRELPVFVPGWEDSSLGNLFAVYHLNGEIRNLHTARSGMEYMVELADWYARTAARHSVGFFQIGGGIAGDFPICVVPMLRQDLQRKNVPLWGYYCQISDSTTSYGSYSGAVPNEKITWGKLGAETPRFVIESDATRVAPLVFGLVLGA